MSALAPVELESHLPNLLRFDIVTTTIPQGPAWFRQAKLANESQAVVMRRRKEASNQIAANVAKNDLALAA